MTEPRLLLDDLFVADYWNLRRVATAQWGRLIGRRSDSDIPNATNQ